MQQLNLWLSNFLLEKGEAPDVATEHVFPEAGVLVRKLSQLS